MTPPVNLVISPLLIRHHDSFLDNSVNANPIFVSGFSRGGTTILMNMLASHPNICTVGEIHQVFKGSNVLDSPWQILKKSATRDFPVMLATGRDFFSPRNWRPRPLPVPPALRFIRRVLESAKRASRHDYLNRFKSPDDEYTGEEILNSRMLGKCLDGSVFVDEVLQYIYPTARFVRIVRNGFALCEGHIRRGRSAEDAGRLYQIVVNRLLGQDPATDRELPVIRFEDLVQHPVRIMRQLLIALQENPFEISAIRMQHRKQINESGVHELKGQREWELRWLPVDELAQFLDPDIDARQIRLLTPSDKDAFLSEAGDAMERLGYWRHQASRLAA